jgi:hypothetical protein
LRMAPRAKSLALVITQKGREGEDWDNRKGINEGAKGRFLKRGPNV